MPCTQMHAALLLYVTCAKLSSRFAILFGILTGHRMHTLLAWFSMHQNVCCHGNGVQDNCNLVSHANNSKEPGKFALNWQISREEKLEVMKYNTAKWRSTVLHIVRSIYYTYTNVRKLNRAYYTHCQHGSIYVIRLKSTLSWPILLVHIMNGMSQLMCHQSGVSTDDEVTQGIMDESILYLVYNDYHC